MRGANSYSSVHVHEMISLTSIVRRAAFSSSRQGGKVRWIMKSLVLALALAGVCGVALADERTVVVPKDDKPFTVEKGDLVRLTGKGIAGSKIEAKVEGPAKVEATSAVRELVKGRPVIGNQIKEFDLKPSGTGKVKVTITVTPPQPDAKPTVTKFEFEVK